MNTSSRQRARRPVALVTRKQAQKILNTSYENVRSLERRKKLGPVYPDERGHPRFDRRVVEELARARGLVIKPSGELAAAIFLMFKSNKPFHDVVIETKQDPKIILELHRSYLAGFNGAAAVAVVDDAEEQKEHERQMAEMDRELERRRRALLEAVTSKKDDDND